MINIIVESFLAAMGAGLLTLLALFIKLVWKSVRADDLTMKALAHDAYFRQAGELLAKDAITKDELENHNHLYKAYTIQGLNGTGDRMHTAILQKEIKVQTDAGVVHQLL